MALLSDPSFNFLHTVPHARQATNICVCVLFSPKLITWLPFLSCNEGTSCISEQLGILLWSKKQNWHTYHFDDFSDNCTIMGVPIWLGVWAIAYLAWWQIQSWPWVLWLFRTMICFPQMLDIYDGFLQAIYHPKFFSNVIITLKPKLSHYLSKQADLTIPNRGNPAKYSLRYNRAHVPLVGRLLYYYFKWRGQHPLQSAWSWRLSAVKGGNSSNHILCRINTE